MPRTIVIRLAILVVIIGWPAFFSWLAEVDEARGSFWLTLHQAYYLPFSWVGPPLFTPDSAVRVVVHPTGRAFAVFFYVLWFYVIIRIVDRRKLASRYSKSKVEVSHD